MDDRAVETVQTALASTRWLPVPCPTEYLPALARDVLWALEQARIAVVVLPELSTDEWGDPRVRIPDINGGRGGYLRIEPGGEATNGYTPTKIAALGVPTPITPADARLFAAALLAAAVAAESVSVAPQEQP